MVAVSVLQPVMQPVSQGRGLVTVGVLEHSLTGHGRVFVSDTVQDGAMHRTGGGGQVVGTADSVAV